MRILIFFLLVFIAACSNDASDNNTVGDAGIDTNKGVDARTNDATPDTSITTDVTVDMTRDVDVNTDVGPDADATMDATPDADAGPDYSERPKGQCSQNADCPVGPQGQMCSVGLPGGTCLGCGDDDDCPGDTECSMFGSCNETCDTDDECPPGLQCTARGLCGAESCVAGECPVPWFTCTGDDGQCERIRCEADPTVCPTRTSCENNWCVEDHLTAP